jgi:ribosomal protein S18 acetylase RimI-like enzyme
MSPPFVIFGLPRSRTYWLGKYLSYGGWHCAHDQAAFVRSTEDVKSWLAQDHVGSVETGAVPWWRLARHYRPDLKMAVIRRDRSQVMESLMAFGLFDRDKLPVVLARYDRALDRAAAAPGCLSVGFDELADEAVCAKLFEHCLGLPFDLAWWEALADQNLQVNLRAQLAYVAANQPQITAAAKACTLAQRYVSLRRQAKPEPDQDGVVIQEESFPDWWRDGQALISEHCVAIGEAPDAALKMNLPLWDRVTRAGVVQIMTARLNGRMMGYLTAVIVPSFEAEELLATQFSFYVSPDARNLNLARRLQRAALEGVRRRGAAKMYMRAGVRGSGPRLGALYRRMGARDYGQLYELDLSQ